MSRVKRGVTTKRRHKKLLSRLKGFKWNRKSTIRQGKQAELKQGTNAYVGRKLKKRDFRTLWNVRINAAVRPHGLNYSRFINGLFKKKILLNRKMISELAIQEPKTFEALVKEVRS